jgi:hypothetical protein
MAKLLKFPKPMSRVQKREARRFALSLSILSVAVVALSLSETLNNRNRPTYILAGSSDRMSQINRAIASAQPYDLVEDVKWESDLAHKIANGGRRPASLGQEPSALDQLRFGPLAGKYRISEHASQVREIEYVDSDDVSDRPVFVNDRQAFLQENKKLLSIGFATARMESQEGQTEVYQLLDQKGQPVGKADFRFDESGRMLSMKVLGEAI